MVSVNGFHHHFCRYVDLIGGDSVRAEELLDGVKGILLGYTCGIVSELIEVYDEFFFREVEGGLVLLCGVSVYLRSMWSWVSNLGYRR